MMPHDSVFEPNLSGGYHATENSCDIIDELSVGTGLREHSEPVSMGEHLRSLVGGVRELTQQVEIMQAKLMLTGGDPSTLGQEQRPSSAGFLKPLGWTPKYQAALINARSKRRATTPVRADTPNTSL